MAKLTPKDAHIGSLWRADPRGGRNTVSRTMRLDSVANGLYCLVVLDHQPRPYGVRRRVTIQEHALWKLDWRPITHAEAYPWSGAPERPGPEPAAATSTSSLVDDLQLGPGPTESSNSLARAPARGDERAEIITELRALRRSVDKIAEALSKQDETLTLTWEPQDGDEAGVLGARSPKERVG